MTNHLPASISVHNGTTTDLSQMTSNPDLDYSTVAIQKSKIIEVLNNLELMEVDLLTALGVTGLKGLKAGLENTVTRANNVDKDCRAGYIKIKTEFCYKVE